MILRGQNLSVFGPARNSRNRTVTRPKDPQTILTVLRKENYGFLRQYALVPRVAAGDKININAFMRDSTEQDLPYDKHELLQKVGSEAFNLRSALSTLKTASGDMASKAQADAEAAITNRLKAEAEFAQLKANVADETAKADLAQREVMQLRFALQESRVALEQMSQELKASKQLNEKLGATIEALQTQVADTEMAISSGSAAELDGSMTKLRDQLSQMQSELLNTVQALESERKDKAGLAELLESTKREATLHASALEEEKQMLLAKLESEQEGLKEENRKLQETNDAREKEMRAQVREMSEEYSRRLSAVIGESEDMKAEIKSLKAAKMALDLESRQLNTDLSNAHKQVQALTSSTEKMAAANSALQETYKKDVMKDRARIAELEQAYAQASAAASRVAKMESQLATVQGLLAYSENEGVKLAADRDKQKAMLDELQANYKKDVLKDRSKIAALEVESAKLAATEKRLSEVQTFSNSVKAQLSNSLAQIKKLESVKDKQQLQLEQMEENYKKDVMKGRARITELQGQTAELEPTKKKLGQTQEMYSAAKSQLNNANTMAKKLTADKEKQRVAYDSLMDAYKKDVMRDRARIRELEQSASDLVKVGKQYESLQSNYSAVKGRLNSILSESRKVAADRDKKRTELDALMTVYKKDVMSGRVRMQELEKAAGELELTDKQLSQLQDTYSALKSQMASSAGLAKKAETEKMKLSEQLDALYAAYKTDVMKDRNRVMELEEKGKKLEDVSRRLAKAQDLYSSAKMQLASTESEARQVAADRDKKKVEAETMHSNYKRDVMKERTRALELESEAAKLRGPNSGTLAS